MTAAPFDDTLLAVAPVLAPETGGDRMNGFERVVNFLLDDLPAVGFVALIALTLAAGAVEMFLELGPAWSVAVTVGLVGAGIYGGTRLRRLPLAPPAIPAPAPARSPIPSTLRWPR